MHASGHVLFIVAAALLAEGAAHGKTGHVESMRTTSEIFERTILSKSYHIDRKYKSMMGPKSSQKIKLITSQPSFNEKEPELLWIIGYRATMMNGNGNEQASQEFMCHSNLNFQPRDYQENFRSNVSMSGRLFTLSQGQQQIDFPEGYGIPVMSDMDLDLATQVLNLNITKSKLDVRHKVMIRFVRDSEVHGHMKPLFQAAVQGFKSLEEQPGHYGISMEETDGHEGCGIGLPAVMDNVRKDEFGQKFTGHWIVKPGREVNTTLVTEWLQLQFDTTIHYIAVHLHPFAESLELLDKTTGKSLFKAHARNRINKIGIEHINHFESIKGIKIYKDHDYELVSIYNNTSGEDQDSMAVMYLYLHDQNFKKPSGHPNPWWVAGSAVILIFTMSLWLSWHRKQKRPLY